MNWLIYLVAAASGVANPAQAGANAQLRKSLDNPYFSAVVVYASGLVLMLLLQLVLRQAWPPTAKFSAAPWWSWFGGALSIASTMAGIVLAQRLGSGAFTGITLTASLTTSVLLDHFGLLGFAQHTASVPRLIGCALLVGGIWLVARF